MFNMSNPFSGMEKAPQPKVQKSELPVLFTERPPDLADFSVDKRQKMLETFLDKGQKLPSGMQTQWLEKFLELDMVKDDQLLACLRHMPESAAIRIGDYMARILDETKYPKSLRLVFDGLEYKEKERILEKAKNNPELLITLAPYLIGRSKLLEVASHLHIDHLQRFFETLMEKEFFPEDDTRQYSRKAVFRDLVGLIYKNSPSFLLPYLNFLKTEGLDKYLEGDDVLKPVAEAHDYALPDTYLKSSEANAYTVNNRERQVAASLNFCEHVFSNYESTRKFMTAQQEMDLLLHFIDNDIPLMLQCAKIGREKMARLLEANRNLKYNGCPFSLNDDREYRAMQAAGMEDLAFAELENALKPSQDGVDYETLEFLPLALPIMDPNMAEKIREKLKSIPAKFLRFHLRLELSENLCTLEQGLEELNISNFEEQLPWLLQNYMGEDLKKIKAKAREMVLHEPQLYQNLKKFAPQILSHEERKDMEAAFFDQASHWSIYDFIRENMDRLSQYLPVLKSTLIKRPQIILGDKPEAFKDIFKAEDILQAELECLKLEGAFDDQHLSDHVKNICGSREATERAIQITAAATPAQQATVLSALERVYWGVRQNRKAQEVKNLPKATYTEWLKKLRQAYFRNCEKNPHLLFQKQSLGLKRFPKELLTEQVIEDYLNTNPGGITDVYRRFFVSTGRLYETADPMALGVMRKHVRTAAFFSELQYERHPAFKEVLEQMKAMNPLLELEGVERHAQGEVKLAKMEKALEKNTFLVFVDDDLAALKRKALDSDGRLDMHAQYVRILKNCLLLEQSVFAKKSLGILAMAEWPERKKLMDLLAMACSLELDFGMTRQDRTPQDLAKTLNLALKNKVASIFGSDAGVNPDLELNLDAAEAVMVYNAGTCSMVPAMQKSLRDFMSHYLLGRAEVYRAWGAPQITDKQKVFALEKMKKRGLLPQGMRLEQYENWLADAESDLNAVITYETDDVFDGVQNALSQAVLDGHVKTEQIDKNWHVLQAELQKLYRPLAELDDRIKPLVQRKEKAKKAKKQGTDTSFTPHEEQELKSLRSQYNNLISELQPDIDRVKAEMTIIKLRDLTAEELESRSLQLGRWRLTFDQAFKLARTYYADSAPEFTQDLERIKDLLELGRERVFGNAKVSKLELRITDGFDFKDYIRIGQEPVPSCQNFDSRGFMNKGLLSYVVDPNVRIIRIFDQTGRPTARCVMRLLANAQGQPCLFLERLYTNNSHKKITEAVVNMAIKKAKAMGVELYANDELAYPGIQESDTVLASNGSRNAFVYTDSGGGLCENGVYQVFHPHKISYPHTATKAA